ncbi:MAG: ABC transporter permease [Fulvivirga sp.]|uniref:ABC transporter permease n=1 Tax=Fulvivirga sp. TaxID=1931237 RepID=UPI0032EF6191
MLQVLSDKINYWFFETNRAERIWLMAKIEFKLKFYENKLGLAWAIIKPVSQIIMYYVVFQVLMNQRVPNYVIYLFAGLMLWLFFTEVTSGTIKILKTKKYLYEYTNMAKLEIYLASIINSIIGFILNFIIFLIGAAISGIYPSYHYIYFILIFINLFILSFGVSLILSNLFLLFKDIEPIWGIVVGFGFFLSPILYRGDLFSKKLPILDYLNPIAGIINNARNVLMFEQPPNWNMFLYDMAYASLLFIVGIFILNKYSDRASEFL